MKKRDTTQCIHTKRLLRLQSAILLLLFVLAFTLTLMRFLQDNDIRAIKDVVTTAIVTPGSITVRNPASFNISNNRIAAASLRETSVEISLARARAHTIFNSIYAPGCSTCQNIASNIDTSLAAEANGQFRGLGGGIRDIEWQRIFISGSSALVTIAATMWSKYAYLDEQGKVAVMTPTGKYVTTYALTKFNGHWLITNQVEDAPVA